MYVVMFWKDMDEALVVDGQKSFEFQTKEDAVSFIKKQKGLAVHSVTVTEFNANTVTDRRYYPVRR